MPFIRDGKREGPASHLILNVDAAEIFVIISRSGLQYLLGKIYSSECIYLIISLDSDLMLSCFHTEGKNW